MKNNSNFIIKQASSDNFCWVTFEMISKGDVYIQMKGTPIWISLKGINQLPDMLYDLLSEDEPLARYESIKKKYTSPDEDCFICGKTERKKITCVYFGEEVEIAWMHMDCRNEFLESLNELCENNRNELASVML